MSPLAGSGPGRQPEHAGLVHGLAGDLVAPDWPPLSDREARWVGERWALPWAGGSPDGVGVRWRSPRPLSAAGIVGVREPPRRAVAQRAPALAVFVKRHDPRVRDRRSLVCEHQFADHLRAAGIPAPEVLRTPDGLTAVVGEGSAGMVYEVHAVAPGDDLYRDAESWTGFATPDHAHAAGELLARLHLAAGTLELGARPFGPLVDSDEIVTAGDPIAAVSALEHARPGLGAGLAPYAWRRELGDALESPLGELARHARALPRTWTHGDWHPSNLTWSSAGRPVAVLDLGLSNRTTAARDIAIAIERSCVSWLAPPPVADLASVQALLDGYRGVRPLSDTEWAALPALTATAHVEFALSEIEYYAGVLSSPERAAVAYRDYLIGHARWFSTAPGRRLLDALAARPGG